MVPGGWWLFGPLTAIRLFRESRFPYGGGSGFEEC